MRTKKVCAEKLSNLYIYYFCHIISKLRNIKCNEYVPEIVNAIANLKCPEPSMRLEMTQYL